MPQRIDVPGMGVVEFPDGMDDEQIAAAIKANQPDKPAAKPWNPLDVPAGLVRGAGSIGATILAPLDMAKDALAGRGLSLQSNRERRAAMDRGLGMLGADPDSTTFALGKIGGELAGTLGTGGLLARGATAAAPALASKAPALLDALGTGGMRAGGLTGAKGLGVRTVGGATTGGASGALIDPESADKGALIGAALPSAFKLAGKGFEGAGAVARGVRETFSGNEARAAADLMRALDLQPQQIPAAVAALRGAQTLVPGSTPTVAQALSKPQASILEKIVSEGPGGERLREALVAQAEARMAALNQVAPVSPTGYAAARTDFGEALGRSATAGDAAARAKTRGLYESVPQDEAALYLPDLTATRDKFFGPGAFVDRGPADRAVQAAQGLSAPPQAMLAPGRTPTLAGAVRRAGGVQATGDLAGEARAIDARNMLRRDGQTLDEMAESMHQRGLIGDESPDALIDALRTEAMGGRGLAGERSWNAAREASMGEAGARKVTLREFDNLRKSIGIEQRAAEKAGNSTLAASLKSMKDQLDERLNEVVRGDGAIDENLPIAWADALDAARKAKVEQVQRFRTGPQASIFRTGSDGQPLAQGGEVAQKFWGNRPGVADDVRSLRRLVDDDPALLGQFRSLLTTEGAGKAAQGGQLGQTFVDWTRTMRPGLQQAFDPSDMQAIERIAADIERSTGAAKLAATRGSDTFQKTSNALRGGLLGSPITQGALERLPGGRYLMAGANGLAKGVAEKKAERLAGLLSDAGLAAGALQGQAPGRVSGLLAKALSRPVTPSGVTLQEILDLAPFLGVPAAATGAADLPPYASR